MPIRELVAAFVAAINDHDVNAILALASPDHRFVDAYGGIVTREALEAAWRGYFGFMPVYEIEVETILAEGEEAALLGQASGALAGGGTWRRPAAWRIRASQGRISLWQVYVDTKIVFDLMAARPQ
jgi:ketosteroid isomerase-like protein